MQRHNRNFFKQGQTNSQKNKKKKKKKKKKQKKKKKKKQHAKIPDAHLLLDGRALGVGYVRFTKRRNVSEKKYRHQPEKIKGKKNKS